MKPMLKYRGGKSREIPEILPYAPSQYNRYVEPFFGGGAMYFYLEPKHALINDLNKPLMDFYLGVRDDYSHLRKELDELEAKYTENRDAFDALKAMMPDECVPDDNEALYYRVRDMFNNKTGGYSAAAVYFFINKTAYSGMIRYNKQGEFNVPYGRYKRFNTKVVSRAHSQLLKNAEIMCGDYEEVFKRCRADDFVFLDPPYDCIFSDYGNKETRDGFNEREHRRLAEAYFKLPSKALMVIGHTDLTHELYRDNIVHEYAKSYAVNIRNRFKSSGKHILVANY
ncbi:Dam family site-specific DNA-(adenine-N6)-methyltransferase [Olsenella sp. DSM 107455]|uniref:site-specific DNA-methyltransferase (adenine-specific) n=1 Tax=Thermophilibacter gallinarum TaxID=2779357 RepID=A0ABR9QSZ4_9ACTN|nr:Dam family site-specific DNA-(adenine-N6)-methyltransferase [Thermophilibacter gallinarum]MBE5024202.1 Dam family site-specific DNA-(adenine-N6)-methyltransferase [Thermophilibacter gallinarum]